MQLRRNSHKKKRSCLAKTMQGEGFLPSKACSRSVLSNKMQLCLCRCRGIEIPILHSGNVLESMKCSNQW
jgi:hypothetical protein